MLSVTRRAERECLVSYQRLTPSAAMRTGDIPAFVRRAGRVQFVPLDPIGRNADMVMQARWPEYGRGGLEGLHTSRDILDVWGKNMSIAHISDWPRFSRFRAR